MEFVVTSNGRGNKVSDKAEIVHQVTKNHIPVDRRHYLGKLRDVFDKILSPLFSQQAMQAYSAEEHPPSEYELKREVTRRLDTTVWDEIKLPLRTSVELKRARVHGSAIAVMFSQAGSKPK